MTRTDQETRHRRAPTRFVLGSHRRCAGPMTCYLCIYIYIKYSIYVFIYIFIVSPFALCRPSAVRRVVERLSCPARGPAHGPARVPARVPHLVRDRDAIAPRRRDAVAMAWRRATRFFPTRRGVCAPRRSAPRRSTPPVAPHRPGKKGGRVAGATRRPPPRAVIALRVGGPPHCAGEIPPRRRVRARAAHALPQSESMLPMQRVAARRDHGPTRPARNGRPETTWQ